MVFQIKSGLSLSQKVYSGSTLTKTEQYIGEMLYLNGSLDYLIHEEGRVALEQTGFNTNSISRTIWAIYGR